MKSGLTPTTSRSCSALRRRELRSPMSWTRSGSAGTSSSRTHRLGHALRRGMLGAHPVAGTDLAELRLDDGAVVHAGIGTAWSEAAALRRFDQIRWAAGNRPQPSRADPVPFDLRQ